MAYYAMNRWLQNFTYPSGGVFALAGGLALVIALVTVSTLVVPGGRWRMRWRV